MTPTIPFAVAALLLCCTAFDATAQSNTFPASGSVGIGTTTPGEKLQVIGNLRVQNVPESAAGTNCASLRSGTTPQLILTRSNNTWWDSWWEWTMGTDNKLRLGYSSVTQLTFSNGRMGIGTDSPLNRLHIADDIRISRATGTWGPNLLLDGTRVGSGGSIWSITSSTASDVGGAGRLAFVNSSSVKFVLDPSGDVGIGTITPQYRLDVSDAVGISRSSNEGPGLWLVNSLKAGNGARWALYNMTGAYGNSLQFWNYGPSNDNPTSRMTLTDSGNLGLGIMNPTNKLEVAGTIRAKEVIVETTGWSDYVFAPDYRLAPLSEVEAHIAAKGTLPGIPSASEVAEHGVSVGDMQAKLLAKVEELTLHVIALSKEVESLKVENAALRTK